MGIWASIKSVLTEHQKQIHVINIYGSIMRTNSKFNQNTIDIDKLLEYLHDLYKDDKCKGILLRINSPGGSAGISEEIARLILHLRTKQIYVVTSIEDICASGAYLIASQSNYIFANKMSLVGSIGVILNIPNVTGLSKKIGVDFNTIKSGKMKDIGNMFREMTEEEKEYLQNIATKTHKTFVSMVTLQRELKNVESMIDGKIVDTEMALQNNLIDAIGGKYDALDYLIKKMNTTSYNVIEYKQSVPLLKKLLG